MVYHHFFDVIHGKTRPNGGPRLFFGTGEHFWLAWSIDPVFVDCYDRLTIRVDIPWKSPIFEQLHVNGLVEHDRKALGITANNGSHDAEPFFKCEYRQLEVDAPALFDRPPGTDKNTSGTDIPDQISKCALP
jgi:hypothetical protein